MQSVNNIEWKATGILRRCRWSDKWN